MPEERVRTDEPLGSIFVPDGQFYCVEAEGMVWGPFFNQNVAHVWAMDMGFERFRTRILTTPITTRPV